MAMAQMNVRIDGDLKRRGDKALAQVGLSPSQAVRRVWEIASSSDADALLRLLNSDDAKLSRREQLDREEELIFSLVDRLTDGRGVDVDELDLDELRYEAYLDKFGDRELA